MENRLGGAQTTDCRLAEDSQAGNRSLLTHKSGTSGRLDVARVNNTDGDMS